LLKTFGVHEDAGIGVRIDEFHVLTVQFQFFEPLVGT
jgi:hypothetical protein